MSGSRRQLVRLSESVWRPEREDKRTKEGKERARRGEVLIAGREEPQGLCDKHTGQNDEAAEAHGKSNIV